MRKRDIKKLKKGLRSLPEISLTPLIDAVLVLLIIFMIAMPVMQNALNLELPKSATDDSPVKKNNESIVISLKKDGNIYINNKQIDRAKYIGELEKKLKNSKDSIVFVDGDTNVKYGAVIKIVDEIKYLAGVKNVALSTQDA